MPDQEIKSAVRYRLTTIQAGEIFKYPGDRYYLFRRGKRIGAAVCTGEEELNVHNIHPGQAFTLESEKNILKVQGNFLTLTADLNETDLTDGIQANRFADAICQFVRLDDGNRDSLIADPKAWAQAMISFFGNAEDTAQTLHGFVAELDVVNRLTRAGLLKDLDQEYRGPERSVHDFELPNMSLEVKAHLYGDISDQANTMTISSENQLQQTDDKELYIIFYRMEETGSMSLASEVKRYEDSGKSRPALLAKLRKYRFVEGDMNWEKGFHTQCEPQVYHVTDDFPRIPLPGGRLPAGIVKLKYTISFSNIPFCPLSEFIETIRAGKELGPLFTANQQLGKDI